VRATAPDRRRAAAAVLVLVAAFALTAPWAGRPLRPVPAFAAVYDAAVIVLDLVTAVLLYAQYRQLAERAYLALACGYIFTPLLMAAHGLSFPDAFGPGSAVGGSQTTAWLWMGWHGLFPVYVAAYALLAARERGAGRPPPPVRRRTALLAIGGTLTLSAAVIIVAVRADRLLPPLMAGTYYRSETTRLVLAVGWFAHLAALAVLARATRLRRLIDLWIAVSLVAWVIDLALSAILVTGRYQLGFYLGRAYGLIGASFVLSVLLRESMALYGGALRGAAALRASEERHRLIVEGARDYAILTTDTEGMIESWSPGAEGAFGWPAAEAIGRPIDLTFTPADRAAGEAEKERRVARESGSAPDVRWHQRRDGSRVFIEGVTRPITAPDRTVRGFLKVGQDVTRRREVEDALRESEARFRAVANLVPDLLWQSRPDGSSDWFNDRWYAYTGQTPDEAAGWGWTKAVHPEERVHSADAFARAVAGSRPLQGEYRIRGADGSYRWFLVRAEPRMGPEGRVARWFGAATDVHDQRMALQEVERRVAERTAELAESNRALAAEIADRERAEAARGEVLRQLVTVEEDERRRISRELHDSVGQLVTGLMLGLRALERAPQGKERLSDLQRLADRIARELQHTATELRPPALDSLGLAPALRSHLEEWSERSAIACDFHASGMDAQRLPQELETTVYRVVQEGLTNVLKHAAATRVGLVLERRRGMVSAILEDDGRGFDVDAVLAAPEKARRLGLRGMRERVALLGGELQIESAPGIGTTLFVRLPDPAQGSPSSES
jgi:PAS domain S-box-containing protein